MPIIYQDICNELQWKVSSGLPAKQFMELVLEFGKAYERIFEVSMQERQSNSTMESIFKIYTIQLPIDSTKNSLIYI